MKVIYVNILTQLDNVINDAENRGRQIDKIVLDRAETIEFDREIVSRGWMLPPDVPGAQGKYQNVLIEFTRPK